ncbi:MAG: 4-hydroxybutyrate CoA-transferase [Chloroflexi bacterium]|nr:4-hydroxybutyrate CoA-transferase [Chloroflexota bacterium]
MDWKSDYQRKLMTAEEAVRLAKSGDVVCLPTGRDPRALCTALAARREELRNVRLVFQTVVRDYAWSQPESREAFIIEPAYITNPVRKLMDTRQADYFIPCVEYSYWPGARDIDLLMLELSPPDEHGMCSFGEVLWNRPTQVRTAKKVIAELNPNLVRTYGDNYVHVSQVHAFVDVGRPAKASASAPAPSGVLDIPDYIRAIAGHINGLIQDGDTIELGGGSTTEALIAAGVFDNKEDLGIFTETIPAGMIELVKKGVFSGKRKALYPGKAVATAFGSQHSARPVDMASVHLNPLFELYDVSKVDNILVIGAHENFVAINNALAVDLTGQVSSESFGPQMYSGPGGQPAFAIGAILSPGGRSIIVVPSTARGRDGRVVSRVAPILEHGTIVTLPRTAADIVVTEYGVAHLRCKTQRQRADALIAIAHPDFRAELRKEAQRLYWP